MPAPSAADVRLELLVTGSCTQVEALARRGGAWRAITFPALVGVVHHPGAGTLLLDTGYTPRFHAATARFPASLHARLTPVTCAPADTAAAQLAAAGVAATDVRTVVLSHLHADHVAGVRDFPAARLVARRPALDLAVRAGARGSLRHGVLPGLLPDDVAARATAVEDLPAARCPGWLAALGPCHDVLGDGTVTAVALPGHQAGHLGLHVRTRGRDVLLVGDAAWSTRAITHLELPHPAVRVLTHDWPAYRRTLLALHRLTRRHPDVLVVPTHCAEGIARARAALAEAA